MNIGYGSKSVFAAIRYDLFFDEITNIAYFIALGNKYEILLTDFLVTEIIENKKKIWVTLSQEFFVKKFFFQEKEVIYICFN